MRIQDLFLPLSLQVVLVCHLFGDNAKCRYSLCIGYSSGLYAVGGFVDQGRVEGATHSGEVGGSFSRLGLFPGEYQCEQ